MSVDPWKDIGIGHAKRIYEQGRHHFFWLISEDGEPAIALRLSTRPNPLPALPKLRNLSISFRFMGESPALFIALTERASIDIFESLCRNIVDAAEHEDSEVQALSVAIRRTLRWQQLLSQGRSTVLTPEAQRGLIAELAFLQELAISVNPLTAVRAWQGPFDSPKDFELDFACIEIKSRRPASSHVVSISSEHQLSDVPGARLFLRVTEVASSHDENEKDLHSHVHQTGLSLRDDAEAWRLWELAIDESGYRHDDDYDGLRWVVGNSTEYEVCGEFPRISVPQIAGVERVSYALQLAACESFKTKESISLIVRNGGSS